MNTITPVLTYLLRSNSDVTSLLSGTAIKAVVAYVTDYITKQSLKTYTIFDVIKSIFDKNSEMLGGNLKRKEKVRKLFTQIVNSLTAKLEIGGPMASLMFLEILITTPIMNLYHFIGDLMWNGSQMGLKISHTKTVTWITFLIRLL